MAFRRIYFNNRWARPVYARSCDWTMIGISQWWSGPDDMCYKICFFGFDIQIWFSIE